MTLSIVILNNKQKGAYFLLKKNQKMTIGRDISCDIHLESPNVSALHGTLIYQDEQVTIQDNNSSNGIYVNGKKTLCSLISEGDFLQLGTVLLQLKEVPENLLENFVENQSSLEQKDPFEEDNVIHRKEEKEPTFSQDIDTPVIKRGIALLHETGKLLQGKEDIESTLGSLLEVTICQLEIGRGCIFYKLHHTHENFYKTYRSHPSMQTPFSEEEFRISSSVIRSALTESEGTVSINTLADSRFDADSTVRKLNIHSIVCAPLRGHSGTLGAIYLHSLKIDRRFQRHDLDLLTAVGRQIGLTIERGYAEEDLKRSHNQLQEKVQERTAALTASQFLLQKEIYERKRASEKLHKSEERYRVIIENIPEVVWTTDEKSNFVYISPNIEKITGYTPQEFCEKGASFWYSLIAKEDLPKVQKQHEALFSHNENFDLEFRFCRKDQQWTWLHIRAVKSYKVEEVMFADGLLSDISGRKQTETEINQSKQRLEATVEELRQTQEQIIQQERLHALGAMASGIAHDFNNALAPISGFSELLLMHPANIQDTDKVSRYLNMIHMSAQDAAGVVRRLRDFYRPREIKEIFKPYSLNELVKQVVMLTKPRWKDQSLAKNVTVTVNTELSEVEELYGNEIEIREAITNLIFNAVDSIVDVGAITVYTYQQDNGVVLVVSDTGSGMSAEVKQKCLEPFFSTKGEKGTGLGLAMVFGIVQRHKGTVEIESVVGEGTSFVISFPVLDQSSTQAEVEEFYPQIHGLKILFVDDEPIVRRLMQEHLKQDGHFVTIANDGEKALQYYKEKDFDVVITDMAMPRMSGDVLAISIKEINPQQPIILLTGFGDLIEASGEIPPGIDFLLTKPAKLRKLREILSQAISK